MTFLNKLKIISAEIFSDTYTFLTKTYNLSRKILTPASPFSQLLHVMTEITELIFYYIEAASSELNISTANSIANIYGLARLTGHNSTRGIAAIGKIGLKIKPGQESKFEGNYLIIPNYTQLVAANNSLTYTLVLDNDYLRIEKTNNQFFECNIVQGEFESQTFIANGEKLQSYSIIVKSLLDHFKVEVTVNGELYKNTESLYDMGPNSKGVLVKTGINGGLDIYFGNGYFGYIPENGAKITIKYIKTNGVNGNILNTNDLLFKFKDTVLDQYSNEVDANQILYIKPIFAPTFGADAEDPEFTKLIAPHMSHSYVLVNPENYIYFLEKYNCFSVIYAYTTKDDQFTQDDNVVYLYLLPDVSKKTTTDINYFSIAEEEFIFTDGELSLIEKTINESGQQWLSSELYFVKPIIKHYVLNIVLSYLDYASENTIRNQIITKLNDYFLNIKRKDRYPKSEIIALLKNIDGIDSINIYYVSQENEKAIADGYYVKSELKFNSQTNRQEYITSNKITVPAGTNPNLGLDEFGDIIFESYELPLIRGGWQDRNSHYYSTDINSTLSSVNIYFKEKIKTSLTNRINTQNFNTIAK